MSEQNKALVRRYVEEPINMGKANTLDELTSADYVGHMTGVPDFDRVTHRQLLEVFRAAFPDMRVKIDEMIAEGDRVVNRSTFTGTHQGEFQGIPPTGKRFSISSISVSRIVNGKVVEDWTVLDQLGMLQQIGVIPAQG